MSLALAYPLLASGLWGGMYVASKVAFDAIPPVTLGSFRLLVGGAVLWAILWRRRGPRMLREVRERDYAVVGLLLILALMTQFLGTDLATATAGALLTTTTPAFVVLLAWPYLRERLGRRTVAGMLLAMAGSVLAGVGLDPQLEGTSWPGTVLLLLSALAFAGYTVYGAPRVRRESALVVLTYGVAWAALFSLPLAWLELQARPLGAIDGAVITAALYVALLATAVGWWLWYRGVAELKAGASAAAFFAQPVVGGFLAWLILGERLGPHLWLGGALVVAGVWLVASAGEALVARVSGEVAGRAP